MRSIALGLVLSLAACGGIVEQGSGNALGGAGKGDESADAGATKPAPAPTTDSGATKPPVPTDAGPTGCVAGSEGGGTMGSTCTPQAELEASAASSCSTGVYSLELLKPCGGAFRYREYTCCGPDGACTKTIRDGTDSSCKDVATWRTYSEDDCARDGKKLGAFTVTDPCGGAPGYYGYNVKCCAVSF